MSQKIGFKHTEETKRKIREKRKLQIFTIETRKKLSLSKKGKRSNNWKDGISQHPDYMVIASQKRRLWQKENGGNFTLGEWELLKIQYGFTCPSCKKSEPEIKLTIDHIIPLSKGGIHNIENIQPLCKSCNCRKHTNIKNY